MTATTMMRVSPATRERVMKIAAEDYGGVTADEALQLLADEHWERQALAAMERFRREDPAGYADYMAELGEVEALDAAPLDPWESEAAA